MRKLLNIILISWLFIQGILLLPILAQSDEQKSLTIETKPFGALVELKGDYQILAQTPFSYKNDLAGRYQVKVSKPGYESWRKTIFFKSGDTQSLNISLSPKTHLKTMFRAASLPGWGHFYTERQVKGYIFGSSFLLSLGYTVIVSSQYSQKSDEYNRLLRNFNPINLTNEEYDYAWRHLTHKHRETQDAYKSQKVWIWCTSTIYLMNIIDALIFYPKYNKSMSDKSGYSISTGVSGSEAQVRLSLKL